MTVLNNVVSLINEKLSCRSSFRGPLIRYLFEGIDHSKVHELLLKKNDEKTIREFMKTDFPFSTIFDPQIVHKRHEHVSADEKEQTTIVMEGFFLQKSGQRSGTRFTTLSFNDLYEEYSRQYPRIRDAVLERGRQLKLRGRCMKTLFYRVLHDLNIYRVKQPHSCPHCNELRTMQLQNITLPELEVKMISQDSSRRRQFYEKQIARIHRRLEEIPLHQKKMELQRKHYQDIRDNIEHDQCILVMDFVSWFFTKNPETDSDQGNKCNDLVVTMEYKKNGGLFREYIDFPCLTRPNKHDHFFFGQVMYFLFFKCDLFTMNGKPRWKRIYRVSDNGGPFKSYAALYVESFIARTLDISYEVITLCPYHAYSMCDQHGGLVKRRLTYAELNSKFPYDDQDMKKLLETLQNTTCFPQKVIDRDFINEYFYNVIGGFKNVLSFKCLRNVGHIRYINGSSDDKSSWGHMFTRILCGTPDPWHFELPKGFLQPSWTCQTINGWGDVKICQRCSSLHGQTVVGEHECVVTEKRVRRTARKEPPQVTHENDDVDASESDGLSDVSVSSNEKSEIGEGEIVKDYLESIIDHGQNVNGPVLYRCHWYEFPSSDDTWQLESTIPADYMAAYKASVLLC